MNLSPSTKGLLIAITTVIVAFGIYFLLLAKKNYYLVDNPSDNMYYFRINNGDEKIISPGQYFQIQLNQGSNKVQVFDRDHKPLYDSAFQVNKNRGLLNISHQDYYINEQFYGYNLNRDSLIAARGATEIDGKNYLNKPLHFNKLYTEDFYYNIDENYDQLIKNIQKIESRTKIFRKRDFLVYYKDYYKL